MNAHKYYAHFLLSTKENPAEPTEFSGVILLAGEGLASPLSLAFDRERIERSFYEAFPESDKIEILEFETLH